MMSKVMMFVLPFLMSKLYRIQYNLTVLKVMIIMHMIKLNLLEKRNVNLFFTHQVNGELMQLKL